MLNKLYFTNLVTFTFAKSRLPSRNVYDFIQAFQKIQTEK